MSIDDRPRVSYMKPIRELREFMEEVLSEIPPGTKLEEATKIKRALSKIDPKIKRDDCLETIKKVNHELK